MSDHVPCTVGGDPSFLGPTHRCCAMSDGPCVACATSKGFWRTHRCAGAGCPCKTHVEVSV